MVIASFDGTIYSEEPRAVGLGPELTPPGTEASRPRLIDAQGAPSGRPRHPSWRSDASSVSRSPELRSRNSRRVILPSGLMSKHTHVMSTASSMLAIFLRIALVHFDKRRAQPH